MMSTMGHGELMLAVHDAQDALLFNQEQLAQAMGSSLRTVQRWYAGRSPFYPHHLTKLVFAVYPKNAEIAGRLAALLGQSLESMGVVAPPPAPPAPEPSPLPPRGPSPLAFVLAESVVAAAAEALDVSPRVARPAVLAAVERAKASGLSIGELLDVLRPPPPAPPPPSPPKRAKS